MIKLLPLDGSADPLPFRFNEYGIDAGRRRTRIPIELMLTGIQSSFVKLSDQLAFGIQNADTDFAPFGQGKCNACCLLERIGVYLKRLV